MNKKTIEILDVRYLRGPNIWTYRPVIEALVDIGDLEECPSNVIPGFNQRLTSWLPTLIEHHCSPGVRGGFLQRLEEGTWPAHILEHVTLELQSLAGMKTGFGKARSTSKVGVYKVAFRSRQEEVSRRALVLARDLVMAAIEDKTFDVPEAVAELTDMVDSLCLGPSTSCIVDAAGERRIPYIRLLNDGNLVQLGYGAAQRRIWTAETDCTSAIAEGIASEKDLTKQLLAHCGVPIPEGRVVDSPADAWDAAQDIGLPVVVKPSDANHGRGVSAELMTQAEVEAAFVVADKEGSEVMVERFLRGSEHRLLVIGGKLVAAAHGEPAAVVGDGVSTVVQLINSQLNTDPRRGVEEEYPLDIINLDEMPASLLEIERQGFSPESIPPAGERVVVLRNGNLANDVTHRVHPRVAAAAVLAAKIIGLDVAGVDIVAEDISVPLEDQGGGIVEVNAGPGLLMHLKPAEGKAQPVGEAIVESLFPRGANGRVPVVGVAGSYGKTRVAGLIARLLRLSGKYVGLACSKGAYVNRRHLQTSDAANWAGGERMLLNRSVTAAVIENGPAAILSEGLAYDRCDVGVVTNLAHKPELDQYYIHDNDHLYNVLRTQVDVVLPRGAAVLNADDARVAEMAELCDGEVIFFSTTPDSAVVKAHLAKDGRAVFARDNKIVLAKAGEEKVLTELSSIPLIAEDDSGVQVGNVLAALGAAWALNIDHSLMKSGAQTFGSPG
ncbi:MAG TPA: cyanophycin synthetase [Rhodocyclaceae bacterium]|nr:cyanophycin synthetase [Rhodocyclaceae bacterium]